MLKIHHSKIRNGEFFRIMHINKVIPLLIIVALVGLITSAVVASTEKEDAYWDEVQRLDATELGVSDFSGLGYLPIENAFFTLVDGNRKLAVLTMRGDLLSTNEISYPVINSHNLAYYPKSNGIFTINDIQGLAEPMAGINGNIFTPNQQTLGYAISLDNITDAQGVTFNPENGIIFVLDSIGPAIVEVFPSGDDMFSWESTKIVERIHKLTNPMFEEKLNLKGLAFNSENGNFYVYSEAEEYIYAVDDTGTIVSNINLSSIELDNLSGMTFAPSSDSTDDGSQMNLFLIDSGKNNSGSTIIELSLTEPVLSEAFIAEAVAQTTIINIIDTSVWSPPNPDSSGLAYLLTEDRLMISDSEVEEMSIYANVNVFESTNAGTLVSTCDTTYYSLEPSGAAANPANGHRFFADDNQRKIFEIDPGTDTFYCTADDIVTFIDTYSFSDDDPEGVAYGDGRLFVTDGVGMEVNVIHWGTNGIFDGFSLQY